MFQWSTYPNPYEYDWIERNKVRLHWARRGALSDGKYAHEREREMDYLNTEIDDVFEESL